MNFKFNAWDEELKHMYKEGNEHVVLNSDGRCYNLQTDNELIPLFFTGKTDRLGKELYLGDLAIITNHSKTSSVHECVFKWGMFGFLVTKTGGMWFPDDKDIEIIGNVYETKAKDK